MALRVFDTNSVGTGVQIDLGSADDLYVAAGTLIATTDFFEAIFGAGIGQTIHIEGQVVSLGTCIDFGIADPTVVNDEVYLGSSSVLRSYDGAAILLYGSGQTIEMHGKVFAAASGLQLSEGGSSESFVTNTGTISGNDYGCFLSSGDFVSLDNSGVIRGERAIYFGGTGGISINNSGTIKGSLHGIETAGGTGALNITNSGVIRLGAILGDQADIYDGRLGRITGDLQAGAGDDRITGGASDERFMGDQGHDILIGGAGADIFIYNAAGDSTFDAIGRDLITDFSHKSRDIIDFSTIIAGELDFVGKARFSGADEIRYQIVGKSTFVYVNLDADLDAEMAIQCVGKIKFVHADFAI